MDVFRFNSVSPLIVGFALSLAIFPGVASAEIVTFNVKDVADSSTPLTEVTATTGAVIPGGVDFTGGDPNTLSYLGLDIDGDLPNPFPDDGEDTRENYYDIRIRTGTPPSGGQLVLDGLDHYPVGTFTGSYVVSKGSPYYLNAPFVEGDIIGDGVEEYVRSIPTWSLALDEGGTVTQFDANADNFVGFKLDTGDFGWMRVQYDATSPGTLTFVDGAYENTGLPIAAGDIGASVAVEGDYNGNNVVDAADYTVWRNNLGLQNGATPSQGDGTGDGKVTPEDYTYWKVRFGNGPGQGSIRSAAVPEPAMLLLVSWAIVPLARSRRQKWAVCSKRSY